MLVSPFWPQNHLAWRYFLEGPIIRLYAAFGLIKITFDPPTGSVFICAKTQNPIVSEKSQLCLIAPKFFLVGSWVIKDPTGNRISSNGHISYRLGVMAKKLYFFAF